MSENHETNLRNEANGSTASFEWRGESFTIPLEYADYPLDYIEAASDGKPVAIQMRALLGPEQWETVRGQNPKGRDLDELEEAIRGAMGLSAGNSEASSA